MNLDVQVEGTRIADELHHLREVPQNENNPLPNTLFVLAVRGFMLSFGLMASLFSFLLLEIQTAFIVITCISFSTLGLVVGGRKVAQLFLPLEKAFLLEEK